MEIGRAAPRTGTPYTTAGGLAAEAQAKAAAPDAASRHTDARGAETVAGGGGDDRLAAEDAAAPPDRADAAGDPQDPRDTQVAADGEARDPFAPADEVREEGAAEAQQRGRWQARSSQDPDRVLPADQRRVAYAEIGARLQAAGGDPAAAKALAEALEDPAEVARYAVALAGRDLDAREAAFLEGLLTGTTARRFLEAEARRMADQVGQALAKLPPEIWKRLQTSWPNLSPAERHATLRRVTTQVAEDLGVEGATLRHHSVFKGGVDERTVAFMLPTLNAEARRGALRDAPADTANAFIGPRVSGQHAPAEMLTLAVAEEAVHLAQRQARQDLETGQIPQDSASRMRLMLLSANANQLYQQPFKRYLTQPMEFEAKVVHDALAEREPFAARALPRIIGPYDIYE